ncbi:hypothetical protein [Thalassovita gelatinovora]|nr:hypothetical protein [Thalassovita gelatinovora]QIZ79376.1 hypothetical protein HFZ77_02265 [Thalassovita gelatinovora]
MNNSFDREADFAARQNNPSSAAILTKTFGELAISNFLTNDALTQRVSVVIESEVKMTSVDQAFVSAGMTPVLSVLHCGLKLLIPQTNLNLGEKS